MSERRVTVAEDSLRLMADRRCQRGIPVSFTSGHAPSNLHPPRCAFIHASAPCMP